MIKLASALFATCLFALTACGGGSSEAASSTTPVTGNPCGGDTAANPCGAAANPCGGAAANPCGGDTAANPCGAAANPCGGDTAANPCAGAGLSDADLEGAIAFIEGVANAIETNKGDCDAMATSLTGVMDSNKALIAKMNANKDDKAVEEKFKTLYKDRMQAAMGKMMGGMQKCSSHAGVQNAMKSMQ